MMKMTSAYANKLIKKLKEDKRKAQVCSCTRRRGDYPGI